jgi:predicted nucleotidyltransferase
VVEAATRWAATAARRPDVLKVGYFGSYARGDWGVGSDLDLVMIVRDSASALPFDRRSAEWDTTALPVPSELLVYTVTEWDDLIRRGGRFASTLGSETVWLSDPLSVPGSLRDPKPA